MGFIQNHFTQIMEVKHPIIQAPMAGGVTTPELVAAVSNNGALGSLGAAYMEPADLSVAIKLIQSKTKNPFVVNLFTPSSSQTSHAAQLKMCDILNSACSTLSVNVKPANPPYMPNFQEQMAVLMETTIPIFSFIFGIPDKKYLTALKENGTKIIGTATCLDEALQLADADVDAIVAQGIEAGGHRGTFAALPAQDEKLSTLSLVAHLCKKINLPIIAAGGIGDAKGVNTALASGAQACQIGTAFLTTHESGAHPLYKKTLLNNLSDNTIFTRAFSGRFARAIHNQFIEFMKAHEDAILPFPIQNKLTGEIRSVAAQQNNPEFMSMWAGQNAALCKKVSAVALLDQLSGNICS